MQTPNNPTAQHYQHPNAAQQPPSDKEFDISVVYADNTMIADDCLYDSDPNEKPVLDFVQRDLAGWIPISPK